LTAAASDHAGGYTPINLVSSTQGHTFEDSKDDDDDGADEEGKRRSAILQLGAEKEQLEVARVLILKQKEEMVHLVKKMREMNLELKQLRSQHAKACPRVGQEEQGCQTEWAGEL